MNDAQSIFVDKFYEMNVEDDELLSTGDKLRNGMVVLLEDSMMRGDPNQDRELSGYDLERLREVNRWCVVSDIEVTRRWQEDDMGRVIGETSPLISFVATYPDGTKKKRRYDSSYAWFVKKFSMEGED